MPAAIGSRKATFDTQSVWSAFEADVTLISEIIDSLSGDLQSNVDTLLSGVERGDYTGVERAAHQVARAAVTIAAAPIADLARRIEAHARHGSMMSVSALCTPIVEARDRLIADLMAWRAEITAARMPVPGSQTRHLSSL